MGEVWLANDLILSRRVAIKQLRPDHADSSKVGSVERMLREARTAAQLHHPNAVAVFDLVTQDGLPHVVMEYVDGESLAERIRREGRLDPRTAAILIEQVARALEAAHRRGIVHRDIKPANVMLDDEGAAKLADFGIARELGDVNLTGTGLVVGTLAYMAPEFARTGTATEASDLWSLGATLYACVDGHAPYETTHPQSTAQMLIRLVTEPVPPTQYGGVLTPLLTRLLDADPAARPSAAETRRQLAQLVSLPSGHDAEATTVGHGAAAAEPAGSTAVRMVEPLPTEGAPELALRELDGATEPARHPAEEPETVLREVATAAAYHSQSSEPPATSELMVAESDAPPIEEIASPPTLVRSCPDARPPVLSTPPDLGTPPDLSNPPDLSTPPDPGLDPNGLRRRRWWPAIGVNRRRRRWRILIGGAVTLAVAICILTAVVWPRSVAPPGPLRDVTVAASAVDGIAEIQFTKPASHGAVVYVHCNYLGTGSSCGSWPIRGPANKVSEQLSLPAGQTVQIALQACTGSRTRQAADNCSAKAIESVSTNGPPPAPTNPTCESALNKIVYHWTLPTDTSTIASWTVSPDDSGDVVLEPSASSYTEPVAMDGSLHSVTVTPVDSRGESGTELAINCTAGQLISSGTARDAAGDGGSSDGSPAVDIRSISWKAVTLDHSILYLSVATASTKPAAVNVTVWLDTDHNPKTGVKGLGCSDPASDSDQIGSEAWLQADGTGYLISGNDAYCHSADAGISGAHVRVDHGTFTFQIPLQSLASTDYLTAKVGAFSQGSGSFEDIAPDIGLPAVKIPLNQ
jgi:tRNA A-37 threonylcarbamoyl transferase component Bud32